MDPQFQRSFIPKKPITAAASSRVPSTINLFSLLAIILFIISLALSGGAFFYKNLIEKQITSGKDSLNRAKDAFQPELIKEIIRRDTRIQTGKQLLDAHVAITPFFDYLSTVTLKSVRFRDFSFSYLAPDKIQVTMRAQGQGYAAAALQSDLLLSQKYLKNTMVSDVTLEPTGTVSFSVSTTVDPSLFSYEGALTHGSPAGTPPPGQSQTSGATSTQAMATSTASSTPRQ